MEVNPNTNLNRDSTSRDKKGEAAPPAFGSSLNTDRQIGIGASKEIATIFEETAELLDIKGDSSFHINAYKMASKYLRGLNQDISEIYKEKGLEGIKAPHIIGERLASKIEEYIKKGKTKYFDDLKKETAIKQVVAYFFETKGISLQELKKNAKNRGVVYARFAKPAKQLIELAGSVEKAKQAIHTVARWANTRKLDYAIETVFKKWLELDRLKPKEVVKKPFYKGDPMIWSDQKKKFFVVDKHGQWLEFADKESTIEWRITE